MKLFDSHFCGDGCSIFIYHHHICGPIAMHTFGVVLVLLLKWHAIFFAGINLLVVLSKTGHNLLRLV
jgi:hypothetical protein